MGNKQIKTIANQFKCTVNSCIRNIKKYRKTLLEIQMGEMSTGIVKDIYTPIEAAKTWIVQEV